MSPTRAAAATSAAALAAAALWFAPEAQAQVALVQCQPFTDAKNLFNCDLCALFEMLNNIISIAASVLVGLSVLMLISGGIRYVVSSGSEHQIATAKKTIQFAIAGIIVVTLAFVIVKATTTMLGYTKDPFSALTCELPSTTDPGNPGGDPTPPSPRPGQQPDGPNASGTWGDLLTKTALANGIEPCAMETLLFMENKSGDPKAIGHDHHSKGPNDDLDESQPPFYNLDTTKSHGIGLLQITIYERSATASWKRWRDSNTPSRNTGPRYYTLPELLVPETNAQASADIFKYCISSRGTDNYEQTFTCYNAGSSVDVNQYGRTANSYFEQCLAEGQQNQNQTP